MPEGSDHLSDVMRQFGLPWVDQYPTYDDEEHWGSAGGCLFFFLNSIFTSLA